MLPPAEAAAFFSFFENSYLTLLEQQQKAGSTPAGSMKAFIKILGITVSKDYEEMKKRRREALADKENLEFLIEHGTTADFQKKYVWKIAGIPFPLYCRSLPRALYCVARILKCRFVNRLHERSYERILRRMGWPQ
jgi:hypothetical protein